MYFPLSPFGDIVLNNPLAEFFQVNKLLWTFSNSIYSVNILFFESILKILKIFLYSSWFLIYRYDAASV